MSWLIDQLEKIRDFRNELKDRFPVYKVVERFVRIWFLAFILSVIYYKVSGDSTLLETFKNSALNAIYAGGMGSIDKAYNEYLNKPAPVSASRKSKKRK